MKRTILVLVALVCARTARAEPTITRSIGNHDLSAALQRLVERADEPVGLQAVAEVPALGLRNGDVVRAINGETARRSMVLGFARRDETAVVYLDVLRGGRAMVIRLDVTFAPFEDNVPRDRYKEAIARIRDRGTDLFFGQVTRAGRPAGVVLRLPFYLPQSQLAQGDIIRKVDHAAVATVDQLVAALTKAGDGAQVTIEGERLGQRIVEVLHLQQAASPDAVLAGPLASIKKIDDRTYDVPRAAAAAIVANPAAAARSVRIVPAIRNGAMVGFKLYAIRPGSLYATLGFANGDTVESVNGKALTSADQALAIYAALGHAKRVIIQITRRGKPITLVYRIK